jgi:hypothetical protein
MYEEQRKLINQILLNILHDIPEQQVISVPIPTMVSDEAIKGIHEVIHVVMREAQAADKPCETFQAHTLTTLNIGILIGQELQKANTTLPTVRLDADVENKTNFISRMKNWEMN